MHVWKFILPYIVLWNNSYDILRHGKHLSQLIQDGHRNALRHLWLKSRNITCVPDEVYKKLHSLHSNCFQN